MDLSILGSSLPGGFLDLGTPLHVAVLKKGPGEVKNPAQVDWTVVDTNGVKLKSGGLAVPPENLLDLDKDADGVFEQPSAKFSIPEYYEHWSCRVLLRVDPENQIPETDENKNTYEFSFGSCQPPAAASGTAGVDLVPDYDNSCLSAPDA